MTAVAATGDRVLRHSAYTRVLHWAVAIFFVLSLLSGLAIYTPWMYAWVSPFFGGGALTRQLHPWFSLAFVACFALQFIHWLAPMRWRKADRAWLRSIPHTPPAVSRRSGPIPGRRTALRNILSLHTTQSSAHPSARANGGEWAA